MSGRRSAALEVASRWVGRGLGLFATLAIVLTVRVIAEAKQEVAQARRAESSGEVETAIAHYRRAARWYVPFGEHAELALSALERIGERERSEGEALRALAAFRAIRGSLEATRSLYVPHRDRWRRANRAIAGLMAEMPAPAVDAGKSRERLAREHLALLEAERSPSPVFAALAALAFLAWAAGAVLLFTRGIDDEDRFRGAEARRWGTLVIVGFGVFVLALSLA